MENLKCQLRNKNRSHYPKKKRLKGKIPGILYGKGMENILFEIGELELNKEIAIQGEHGTINLEINNHNHKALIKELQREAVNHNIVHIDLQEIDNKAKVHTEVPLIFTGENLVKKDGGIIQKEKNSVKVQGRYENIPKAIEVDISKMKVGDVCRVADLEISSEITFVDDIDTVILAISKYNTSALSEEEKEEVNEPTEED
ncbi:50S ribosomal protein L25 [Clostridium aestuarii]|uniref:Large ribosomal subunit protein bL25 n=1 Tax=Clostridium aestuarii TaxID=338193 RepID=A0ABT4CX31_9CLOT|nr:50S ribosomal protein L25 [Clostridium aestuarii]MCY6483553.1 50S ribosomal protein L25 [Clostridium aestuarii]